MNQHVIHTNVADSCKCSIKVVCSAALITTQVPRSLEPVFIQTPTPLIRKKSRPTVMLIIVSILFSSVQSHDLIRDTWYKGFSDSEDVMLRYVMGVNGLDGPSINRFVIVKVNGWI